MKFIYDAYKFPGNLELQIEAVKKDTELFLETIRCVIKNTKPKVLSSTVLTVEEIKELVALMQSGDIKIDNPERSYLTTPDWNEVDFSFINLLGIYGQLQEAFRESLFDIISYKPNVKTSFEAEFGDHIFLVNSVEKYTE